MNCQWLQRKLLFGLTLCFLVGFAFGPTAWADSDPPARRYIVYIIDVSGSTMDTLPFSIMEVKRSINGLSREHHAFTVILCKNDRAFETPPIGWKIATPLGKRNAMKWIDPSSGNIVAGGRTNIIPALKRALELKPNLVYVISDGLMSANDGQEDRSLFLAKLSKLNLDKSGIRFNALQFYYADPTAVNNAKPVLQILAQSTGGIYKYVEPKQLSLMSIDATLLPPVFTWAAKLKIDGSKWNERPHDLKNLTEYLSRQREIPVKWSTVSIDDSFRGWPDVIFLSSPDKLTLSKAQEANLRSYIERGGMLICNPQGKPDDLGQSVRAMVTKWHPQWKMGKVDKDHPLYWIHHHIDPDAEPQIEALSNGARDLVILLPDDWSKIWENDTKQSGPVWELSLNLFSQVTDRGSPINSQDFRVKPISGKPYRTVVIGRARYEGNWLPEPLAWETFGEWFFEKTAIQIKTKDIDLASIGKSRLPLIQLAGTKRHMLTDQEKKAIKLYVDNGGVLLVDNVGGIDRFSREIDKQLVAVPKGKSAVFSTEPIRIEDDDAIISGRFPGGYDNSKVEFRRRTVQLFKVGMRPRLFAIYVDKRPAVIFNDMDLTLGTMGVRHWYLNGYAPQSARKLMSNIVLHFTSPK